MFRVDAARFFQNGKHPKLVFMLAASTVQSTCGLHLLMFSTQFTRGNKKKKNHKLPNFLFLLILNSYLQNLMAFSKYHSRKS